MNTSYWLNVDLHIHSVESNLMKENKDYKGKKYSGSELINVLSSHDRSINIFSVTDHDIVNVELYDELSSLVNQEEYKGQIDYIVGVELDVLDKNIYDERIHVLCLFESKDHHAIQQLISSFDLKNQGYIDDIQKLFNAINNELNDKRFILIPHFNNKSEGIPADSEKINELTRLMFNAYEDSNNVDNIKKSLSIYLKNGYVDFPFVAFSDCHDLKYYPSSKEDDSKKYTSSFLGNINQPFNTIKTAFEEPRLRISIHGIDGMRTPIYYNKQISLINYNDKCLELSPSLNTIIGPFGSGKSLLINKMINGVNNVDSKYASIVNPAEERFSIEVEGTKFSSLKEVKELSMIDDIIQIEQDEDLYFKNKIETTYIEKLSDRLGFNIPTLENESFDINVNGIISNLKTFNDLYEKNFNSYTMNYSKAFEESKGFQINFGTSKLNLNEIYKEIEQDLLNLQKYQEMNIMNDNLFTEKELDILSKANELLLEKMTIIQNIEIYSKKFFEILDQNIQNFNKENDIKKDKEQKTTISNTINNFCNSIINLFNNINIAESSLTESVFKNLASKKKKEDIGEYRIQCTYDLKDNEYQSLKNALYTNVTDESLSQKIFESIYIETKLRGKKDFTDKNLEEALNKYQSKYNRVFNQDNLDYDILISGNPPSSIIQLSAGGRAKELLKIAFAKIISNIRKNKKTVVLVDQPENNMDNESIKTLVVENVKAIKLLDRKYLVQFLIVTHNANVCITSDSENIIIAKNPYKNRFDYDNGSIENTNFISGVCDILEGGELALKTRAVKYNINILKGMEIHERN